MCPDSPTKAFETLSNFVWGPWTSTQFFMAIEPAGVDFFFLWTKMLENIHIFHFNRLLLNFFTLCTPVQQMVFYLSFYTVRRELSTNKSLLLLYNNVFTVTFLTLFIKTEFFVSMSACHFERDILTFEIHVKRFFPDKFVTVECEGCVWVEWSSEIRRIKDSTSQREKVFEIFKPKRFSPFSRQKMIQIHFQN